MLRCPSCQAETAPDTRFCGACGAPVAPSSVTPTRAVPRTLGSSPTSSGSLDNARFTPGTMVAERYRVVGLLGRGGMGEVYRAEDLTLGQQVALKFLPELFATDPGRLSRFLQEVRNARQVTHPNVCRVYDIGQVDGQHFISMEYVDGEDLSVLLRRIGRLPGDKAVQIARQLCAGLAAAHDRGILHRDLKPANVMLDGQGRVRITDFGLSGLAEGFTGEEVRAGTPAYQAPEQLAGTGVSVRSDIYALGLVMYELFSGKPAYQASSAAELRNMQQSTPASLSSVVSDMDDAVERIILCCLEQDPRERPPSALAVAAALPGGDPLAAALAAGETPSPEMVANAGAVGSMRPRAALACLAGALLSIVLPFISLRPVTLLHHIPAGRTPEDLAAHARELLAANGFDELPKYQASGHEPESDYLNWIAENDHRPSRWDVLQDGDPAPLLYWYRVSPSELSPRSLHRVRTTSEDPAQSVPGSATIFLDMQGRLRHFEALPPEAFVSSAPGTPATESVLAQAGIDAGELEPVDLVKAPRVPTDTLQAWRWKRPPPSHPPAGDVPAAMVGETIVQAGWFGGRLTYFEIVEPWNAPEAVDVAQTPQALRILFPVLIAVLLGGGLLLARHNLKQGRSDRRGAFRFALILTVALLLTWLLVGIGLRDIFPEAIFQLLFGQPLGHALVHAAIAWILYVAIEPYVRRLWPGTLVSWTRLLMGRLRDPLVGRDILLGGLAGGAAMLLISTGFWIQQLMGGLPSVPDLGPFDPLEGSPGVRSGVATLIYTLRTPVMPAMGSLVLLLLFRVVLRRLWAAFTAYALLLLVIFTLGTLSTPFLSAPAAMLSALFFAATIFVPVLIMLRTGLVAGLVGFYFFVMMGSIPLALDLSRWYAGQTVLTVGFFAVLFVYAFWMAMAGQSVFKESLFDRTG